jgi:hypothetical protein
MSGGQVSQQEAEDIRVEIDEAVQSLKNITNLVLEKLNDTQLPADELEALHESLRGLSSFSKQIKLAVEKVKEKVDASDGVSGVPHSQSGAPVDATPSGSEVSEHPPVATASTSPSKPSDSSAANSASEDAAVRGSYFLVHVSSELGISFVSAWLSSFLLLGCLLQVISRGASFDPFYYILTRV